MNSSKPKRKLWPREIAMIRKSTEPARDYANRLCVPAPLITAIRERRAYAMATRQDFLNAYAKFWQAA